MVVRKYESKAVRQSQIIDAARKLIISQGSEHVTIKRIAREVGISEAAIYRHFKSKADILTLLVQDIEASLLGDISAVAAKQGGALDILDKTLRNHISAIKQRQGISFQVIAEIVSLGDKDLNRQVSGIIRIYIERIKEMLAAAAENGEVRPEIDPESAATLVFGMIQGLVNIWALNDYSFDIELKYAGLWQVFQAGIGTQSGHKAAA